MYAIESSYHWYYRTALAAAPARYNCLRRDDVREPVEMLDPPYDPLYIECIGVYSLKWPVVPALHAKIVRDGPMAPNGEMWSCVRYNTALIDDIERLTCMHIWRETSYVRTE